MNAKILPTPPLSGTYPEQQFDVCGNSTWVKFTDNDYTEWCGIFGGGGTNSSYVCIQPESGLAFVISAGQGFLIDIASRRLLYKPDNEFLLEALFIPGTNRIVACDWTNIYVISDHGIDWDSGRISFDGINFANLSGNTLTGSVNDLSEDWPEFSLNLETLEYSCPFKYKEGAI